MTEESATSDGTTRDTGEDATTDDTETRSATKAAVDSAAESFIEIEEEFDGVPDGITAHAQAVDVERVPAAEVPEDFPFDIRTEEAMALRLTPRTADERTVVTYFEWPEEGTDDRLGRLLGLHEIPPDRFADLHGREILLRAEGGHWVPAVPDEQPRGDGRALYGVIGGLAPGFTLALFGIFGLGNLINLPFIILWLVATFVVLPVSVYLDAWHLRTHTDWEGGPLFWATLSVVPVLNLAVGVLYLLSRGNARPIQ
jgi:hypothetical protein